MANSKLNVVNRALSLLGVSAVESLDDLLQTPAGRAIANNYDETVQERMRAYAWSFLTQSERLVANADESPYNGAWARYALPNNILRVVTVLFTNARNRAAQYKVDSDGIHAPSGGYLTVVFMRAKPEADWSPEFSRYIQACLALAAAGKVKANYVEALTGSVQRRYEVARTTDVKASRGNEVQAFDATGILRAIGGGGSHRYGIYGGGDYYAGGIYIPN